MRIVSACIVALVNQFDLFNIFLFGFVEVSAGCIDDHTNSAGFRHGN